MRVPTRHPYLYRVGVTVNEGIDPGRIEEALTAEIGRLARGDIEERDLTRAKNQFLARHALESESTTDAAHQLGFFETVAGHRLFLDLPRRGAAVTAGEVAAPARARPGGARGTGAVLSPGAPQPAPPARGGPGVPRQ